MESIIQKDKVMNLAKNGALVRARTNLAFLDALLHDLLGNVLGHRLVLLQYHYNKPFLPTKIDLGDFSRKNKNRLHVNLQFYSFSRKYYAQNRLFIFAQ